VAGISLAGGAAWWYQNKASGPSAMVAATSSPAATTPRDASKPAAGRGSEDRIQGGNGQPPVVEVGKVEAINISDDAQAVGSLRSNQGVMLRPEVSGRISRLEFKDGQRVRRGQLLVQLDDTLQVAQVRQAQAQASIARTNLQRNRELVAQNFVSASVVDQNVAALQVAEAQVALTQAQLARMRILAPFDGVAGIRSVNVGDYVKDGADIVNIEDISSVWVDFRLAERYVSRLKPGQLVEAQLDAFPGRIFKGRVDAVDSLLDANGRSLLVRARLPNANGELRSGMFARARVIFEVREMAMVVPEEALVPQGGKQYLIKVVNGPKGQVSQRLEARIGVRLPGKVEILDGVAAGDLVVTAGQSRLMRGEGMPVKVVDIDQPRPRAPAPGRGASAPAAGSAAV
jgi:membrane fusion protein (multidrug efflux system)